MGAAIAIGAAVGVVVFATTGQAFWIAIGVGIAITIAAVLELRRQ
jgi:hypothetical protein